MKKLLLILMLVSVVSSAPAVITVQPVSDTVVAGQAVTFFVTSISDSVTYQWYRNDSIIVGATNDTFTYTSRLGAGYTDNIRCALTTDTTISTHTVSLTVNGVIFNQSIDTLVLNSKGSGTYRWDTNGVQAATTQAYTILADSVFYARKIKIDNYVNGIKKGTWNFIGGTKRGVKFK